MASGWIVNTVLILLSLYVAGAIARLRQDISEILGGETITDKNAARQKLLKGALGGIADYVSKDSKERASEKAKAKAKEKAASS